MSEILGLVALSHSPFATLLPPDGPEQPGGRFLAEAARLSRTVARLAPDAVVVIGPDHFHANFYDAMPPFLIGVEHAVGFGDFGSRPGPLPVAAELAWSAYDGLTRAGFDLSLSYSLTVDHGLVQSYEMVCGGADIPMVPLVVNTAAPPLPTMERCIGFGRALGDTLRGDGAAGRVLLIASGGLSHWLPTNDPRDPAMAEDRRHSVIHGREDAQAFAAAREPRVRAMGGDPHAHVNSAWDRWFLKQLGTGESEPIAALGDTGLEEQAGSGGHEIRTWLIGHAAVRAPLVWSAYEPVPEWITGMGIGATFEVE
ncbi:2,3-dihydroxyphenylpropionate 1,2-dioxygenase [Streptomyces sp. N50]|uniref:DODA-type extradiol aromatic ring-opening family dioxygenase n=1 Tax=Streptomyces sp. N50 TaxID=3081765 RepID=UPI002961FEAB|nr:2,3-dihydroxyphenylpropionate 1,2-dioxygenase [Streptomyces sp. N50]WOX16344.1 2,3-dihydroxyphenylpropionate 1,2-dioxygenase [Streptomyces sp. N50]